MGDERSLLDRMVGEVERVRAIPYRWPGPPDAASVLREGFGTCASKHALLAERLALLGVESAPLLGVGRLVPELLADREPFRDGVHLLEVHECLTVLTPWAGPLVVDVTWDPPLIRSGLPGKFPWSGDEDMPLAIPPEGRAWAVPAGRLREAKESIRRRLYTPEKRALRDRILEGMSQYFTHLRAGVLGTEP